MNAKQIQQDYEHENARICDLGRYYEKHYHVVTYRSSRYNPEKRYITTEYDQFIMRCFMNEWQLRSYYDYSSYLQWFPIELFEEVVNTFMNL